MNNLKLNFVNQQNYFTLNFNDDGVEELYKKIRSSRILNIFPRLVMAIVSLMILFRRTQLLISAKDNKTVSSFSDEIRTFTISLTALILELITHLFERLANFRCVAFIILSFYTSIDGSLTYYLSRVPDEPVFAYGSFQFGSATPLLSVLLCQSWIGSLLSHLGGQCILLYFAFSAYNLNLWNQIYMSLISVMLILAYCICFYSIEYVIRFGVFQYYRTIQVFFYFRMKNRKQKIGKR